MVREPRGKGSPPSVAVPRELGKAQQTEMT